MFHLQPALNVLLPCGKAGYFKVYVHKKDLGHMLVLSKALASMSYILLILYTILSDYDKGWQSG